jgi:glyoxylase-like metal-dependent hydrolase (beta-lactamase superfamily II)
MSDDVIVPRKWWEILPRKIYKTLIKVKTKQPWFDVYKLHDWLFAIYEGGQFDEPLMYLVIGNEKAVVIDGGNGIGNIALLVEELTDKQYFLLLTHTHNDHIGGCKHFKDIAVFDDIMSWERAAKGYDREKMSEIIEEGLVIREFPSSFDPQNYFAPPFTVSHWLKDGDIIDLGDRKLEIIHSPGHSSNHICLLDRDARYLWTGDLFYTGGISTYLPGGNHDDFILSLKKLLQLYPSYDILMPAHNEPLVEKEILKKVLNAAERIKFGTEKNYTEGIGYEKTIRRYQYQRFALITDEKV